MCAAYFIDMIHYIVPVLFNGVILETTSVYRNVPQYPYSKSRDNTMTVPSVLLHKIKYNYICAVYITMDAPTQFK